MGHMIANLQVNILHLDMTFLMSHHNFLQQDREYKRVYHQLENIQGHMEWVSCRLTDRNDRRDMFYKLVHLPMNIDLGYNRLHLW